MNKNGFTIAPDEFLFIEFFESVPIEVNSDLYWCYEACDIRGVRLRFSYHLIEKSVQTTILLGDSEISTISHECASKISIENLKENRSFIRCEFDNLNLKTVLKIYIKPHINVQWESILV